MAPQKPIELRVCRVVGFMVASFLLSRFRDELNKNAKKKKKSIPNLKTN